MKTVRYVRIDRSRRRGVNEWVCTDWAWNPVKDKTITTLQLLSVLKKAGINTMVEIDLNKRPYQAALFKRVVKK